MKPEVGFCLLLVALACAGCSEPAPVVKACTSIADRIGQGDAADACSCIDDTARRQLDPEQYAAFEAAVEEADIAGSSGSTPNLAHLSQLLAQNWNSAPHGEGAIVLGDIALIASKAASRCSNRRGWSLVRIQLPNPILSLSVH